ncbi:hypothetical protein [Sphingosinithalassobacter sp. CS137]|uniref:hypothetical protein n=1 Tax=Sphingosinithalassobacter sp. CS137 TaxID=2762748 RepID=UPI00165EB76B|nr:hypothetical protein [Sphingosinithalassobacter sp. CS137]
MIAGLAFLLLALLATITLHALPPTEHAYNAVVAALLGYAVLHVALGMLIRLFVARRAAAGFHSPRLSTEPRIARLWTDYGAGTGIVVLLAVHVPGLLA